MNVCIVGGSGFIGRNVAEFLSEDNKVRIVDIKPSSLKKVEFKKCDVLNSNLLEDCLKDCEVVIDSHIIQIPRINEVKELAFRVNVLGTKNICEACRKNDLKLLLLGTWHVYGELFEKYPISEDYGYHLEKVSERAKFYVINKVMQELMVKSYNEMYGIECGILRLGTVLGEDMSEKTVAKIFINQALKGEDITPFRSTRYRPMFYVDINDVKEAVKRFIEILNPKCETIHIAYPEPITIIELAELIKNLTNSTSKIRVVNDDKDKFKPDDKKRCALDLTRLKEKLKMRKLISIEESLKRIVQSIKGSSS